MKKLLLLLVVQFGTLSFAQGPLGAAALPLNWVDPSICTPLGGYDVTITVDGATSTNNGPNHAGGAIGSPYAATYLGALDAFNNWRDNGANTPTNTCTPGVSCTFVDAWWHVLLPAQVTGTVFHSLTFDANLAIWSIPGKNNGIASTEPTKCLVIESTAPLPAGQTVCSHGLPGFGGTRNPGCTSPYNDESSMWKLQFDAPLSLLGRVAIYEGADLVSPTNTTDCYGNTGVGCWTNHVLIKNGEIAIQGGADQSIAAVKAPYLVRVKNNIYGAQPCATATPCVTADHIGFVGNYLHGNDPGDAGQPAPATITAATASGGNIVYTATNNFFSGQTINIIGLSPGTFNCTSCVVISTGLSTSQFEVTQAASGSSTGTGTAYDIHETSNGACTTWTNTGTVNVAPDGANPGTSLVTLTSAGAYFGLTFTVGSTININGVNQTIANTPYTQAVLTGTDNLHLSITGSVTLSGVAYTQSNPPAMYAFGCGDDVVWGMEFSAAYGWKEYNYMEKIHWWGSESHVSQQGFSAGPIKDVHNWEEGGSINWFNGGAPTDTAGGPAADQEIRGNYHGRDLNWRQLTGSAGSSPAPPWGCGSADSHGSHNTCPFTWAIKNSTELKLGHRVLFDGNIVENSWADGQTGWCIVYGPRTCSGGAECGVYDAITGLPKNAIDNTRFSNNWIRNCPEPLTTGSRSGPIGDGGGVSLPSTNFDVINNLMTNINDINQQGNPNDQWVWGAGANNYPCAMSRTANVATALCVPFQQDLTAKVSQITSTTTTGTGCTSFGATSPCSVIQVFYGPGAFGSGERLDPMLSTGIAGTVIANSASWTTAPFVIANHVGWDGSFAQLGTSGNWASDGTGGNGIQYIDTINNPGNATLCDNTGGLQPKCSDLLEPSITLSSVSCSGSTATYTGASVPSGGTGVGYTGAILTFSGFTASSGANNGTFTVTSSTGTTLVATNVSCVNETHAGKAASTNDDTYASLGFKMTDISVGDAVNATSIGGGDTTCVANGYAVGATSATYAITGTIVTGLTVVYNNSGPNDSGTTHCTISNGSGFPKNVTLQQNTEFCPAICSIQTDSGSQQSIGNQFFNNVWADNDAGTASYLHAVTPTTPEGTATGLAGKTWDSQTFEYYHNVDVGRVGPLTTSTTWVPSDPLGLCPGCTNFVPSPVGSPGGLAGTGANTGVNCATGTATANCLGLSGFMGTSPAVSFPASPCAVTNAPFNCPLMALPWANNLTLSNFAYAGSSSYSAYGVNPTLINTAMTQNLYVCPIGASCGVHGPFPDSGGTVSQPLIFPAVSIFAGKAPLRIFENGGSE